MPACMGVACAGSGYTGKSARAMVSNNNDNNFMRAMVAMRMAQAPTVRNAASSARAEAVL